MNMHRYLPVENQGHSFLFQIAGRRWARSRWILLFLIFILFQGGTIVGRFEHGLSHQIGCPHFGHRHLTLLSIGCFPPEGHFHVGREEDTHVVDCSAAKLENS